jgi:L-erythro-3,5-diaminohexanoate dehydrogenase
MATSFAAAALGAEGLAADVTMLIGNGYLPGHAAYALDLIRREPAVRALFQARLMSDSASGSVGSASEANVSAPEASH